MYVCAPHACLMPAGIRRRQLELQITMSRYVMLGLELKSSAKATSSLNY